MALPSMHGHIHQENTRVKFYKVVCQIRVSCQLHSTLLLAACSPACIPTCQTCNTNVSPPKCQNVNENQPCGSNSKCRAGICTYVPPGKLKVLSEWKAGTSHILQVCNLFNPLPFTPAPAVDLLLPTFIFSMLCSLHPRMPTTLPAVQHSNHATSLPACKRRSDLRDQYEVRAGGVHDYQSR